MATPSDKPWRQAPWNPLRRIIDRGTAITPAGTNRHTGQPVDVYGLTFEADALRRAILERFPDSPTKRNYAVDRAISGGTALSDHARGEALDIMVPRYDGAAGISARDRAYGRAVMDFIVASCTGPVAVGLRGKRHQGTYRVSYVLFDGLIHDVREGRTRPLKPTSNQHRDHVHVSIVPVDRAGATVQQPPNDDPPDEPPVRPVLRRGSVGDIVRIVQAVVGATIDGRFGPQTERRVRAYQARHRLTVDGIVGPQTWRAIDVGLR